MAPMPSKMKIGFALGLIGGIYALIAMAVSWNGDLDSMATVGLNMLIAVMFFATAGTFTKYAPVAGRTVLIISVLTLAVVILGFVHDATFNHALLIMAILALACILIGACPNTAKWVDNSRLI